MSSPTTPPPAAGMGSLLRAGPVLLLRAVGWLLFIGIYALGVILFNAGRILIAASEAGLRRTTHTTPSVAPAATPATTTPPSPVEPPPGSPSE